MSLFSRPEAEDRPSVKVGRVHEAPVEIHRHGGDKTGPYWYQGNVRVLEEQVRTTEQLVVELRDPLNTPTLNRIQRDLSDEQIVEEEFAVRRRSFPSWTPSKLEIDAALTRVQRLRWLAKHSKDQHIVRVFSLDRAGKSEERILAFVDQDPIKEAPQKRYTETEKGWRHKQLVITICMGAMDVLFLVGMLTFASAPVSSGAQAAQLSAQAGANLTYILISAGWIATVIGMYLWMAGRTLVSSWEIEPIKLLGLDTHSEAVYLQNSQAAPSSEYLSRLLGLSPEAISDYALAVAKLPVDAMSTMQEQVESQRKELDTVQMRGIEQGAMNASLRSLGMRRPTTVYESGSSLWLIVGIVLAVGIFASIAVAYLVAG